MILLQSDFTQFVKMWPLASRSLLPFPSAPPPLNSLPALHPHYFLCLPVFTTKQCSCVYTALIHKPVNTGLNEGKQLFLPSPFWFSLWLLKDVWTARAPLRKGWDVPLCWRYVWRDLSLFFSSFLSFFLPRPSALCPSVFFSHFNCLFFFLINLCLPFVLFDESQRNSGFISGIHMVLQRSWLGLWCLWIVAVEVC